MTNVPANRLIDQLIRSVSPGDGEGQTDGDLLTRFVECRDGSALDALVHRHGTMVWGVCVRALHNQHDAEDAFQATFLVLVRKAATVIPREMVGNWLYGVAHQVTLQARRVIARRRAREVQVINLPDTPVAQADVSPDLRSVLDEELVCLPVIYRAVVVLCDLEGRTRKEVAHRLGLPEGTVGGRLARARTMLGKRLARRGMTASGPLLATTLASQATAAPVPAAVVSSTITTIASVAAEQAATVAVSPAVAELVSGVTKAMFMTKLKAVTIVALLSALILGGVGTGIRLLGGSDALARQKTTPAVEGAANGPMAGSRDEGVDDLQGEWRVVEWEEEGGKAKDLKGKRLVIKGDEVTTIQAQLGLADKLSFKLDPGKSPKEIDLTALNGWTKGVTHPGIYEIEGRRLRICYGVKVRPKEFETTPVSGLVMVTLERDGKGEKEVSTAWGQEVGGFARTDDKKATGTLTGRFVFDGEPPAATDLFPELSKIDPAMPHIGQERGGESVYRTFLDHGIRPDTKDESLVVGKKNGVANVVIWAASKDIPWTAPDDLGKRPVTIKLKNGNYSPRVTVASVGQPVQVENHDPVGFHFRVDPSRPRNKPVNQLLKPNSADAPLRLVWEEAEARPAKYESNLGPWANGWLFVHANSFVAVSGADGSFRITDLPPGEWEFRAWHERQGDLKQWPKGVFKHTVKPADNDLGEIKLKPLSLMRQ